MKVEYEETAHTLKYDDSIKKRNNMFNLAFTKNHYYYYFYHYTFPMSFPMNFPMHFLKPLYPNIPVTSPSTLKENVTLETHT